MFTAVIILLGSVVTTPANGTIKHSSIGFERTCTVELETATWCGFCPYVESALRSIEEEYPKERLAIVSHHYKDSLSCKNSTERMYAYGTIATPTSIFNGNSFEQGGDPNIKSKYIKQIDYQLNRKTPFLVHLRGDIQEDFLKLNAYLLGWGALPENLNYTFLICENKAKASGRTYNWVCRDVKPRPNGQPFTLENYNYKEFELNWNIPSDVDWEEIYALFVVESFSDHDIYQTGIWRRGYFQVEKFDTPLGIVFDESPDELEITFSNYKRINDGVWEIIDSDHIKYDSTGSFDGSTLTIIPDEPLPSGKKYAIHIHSGDDSIGTSSTFLQSPAFVFFEIEGKPTLPPEPSKEPPQLSLSTLGVDMGIVEENRKSFEFIIENKGDEPLDGEISASCDWVTFEEEFFSEVNDQPLTIKGYVHTDHLESGIQHSCTVDVTSNGGNAKIGIKLEKSITPPILDVHPNTLVFEGESISQAQTVTIRNLGGAELIGSIDTSAGWLIADKAEFSNDTEINISVVTNELTNGKHTASIEIESNGGEKYIEVNVIIPEKTTVIELMYGSNLAVVDGEIFTMEGEPYLIDGHTMISAYSCVKFFYDETSISWTATAVTITYMNTSVTLTCEHDRFVIDEEAYSLPASVALVDTSMYVPIEFIMLITDRDIEATIKGEPKSPTLNPIVVELIINKNTATVDGEDVDLAVSPTIINNRTVVPLRFVSETFGFKVNWNADTGEITLTNKNTSIILKADLETIEVVKDDETTQQRVNPPPTIIDGHTMVPIRFISDVLNADIEWIGKERKIIIQYQP